MPNDKTPLLRVFLVDDETLIRTGMKRLLDWESLGFTVVGEAENGRDALPQILSLSPHLVLTDLKMPFVGGLELARQVREALPLTEVIVLTGYDEFDYARQAIRVGVFDFLLKPISPQELTASLLRLRRKREGRALPYPYEREAALLSALSAADADAAERELETLFSRLAAEGLPRETLGNIADKLADAITRTARRQLGVLSAAQPTFLPDADEKALCAALCGYVRQILQEYESTRSSALVRDIGRYLEENYQKNITLAMLEEEFFFNASYISRIFKQKTGVNYSDRLLDIRLTHAKELLRSTDRSIGDISEETGFGNAKYFSRIFKEKVGVQPIVYRKRGARRTE